MLEKFPSENKPFYNCERNMEVTILHAPILELLPSEIFIVILQHLEFNISLLNQLRTASKWYYEFLKFDNINRDIFAWEKRYSASMVSLASIRIFEDIF